MSAVPPLRSLSADAAIQLAMREADRLGMRLEAQSADLQRYPIVVSNLLRGHNQVVATGAGRGEGSEGVAGSHFEALECYYISAQINRYPAAHMATLKKAEEVARQPGLAGDLVIQRWAEDFPQSMAACDVYQNADLSVWYPIFLVDPHYHREPLPGDSIGSYRSMIRYMSSVGTAAGSTMQEACLHGLCELIEHDAVSLALLRWFVARTPHVEIVDISSLPDGVKNRYEDASEAIGDEVILFDVTTDIGVPAYLACGTEAGPWGSGASPIGEHAALRALTELMEGGVLGMGTEDRSAKERLEPWPILQQCLTVPSKLRAHQDIRSVSLRGDAGNVSTVESALETVTSLVRRRDIYSYTREVSPPDSLISVVSTIAPGLERFSLVRMGIPVIPTGRGWNIWAYRNE